MISSTFGAPLGGTTRGGQYGFESLASSLITPSNAGGGGGNCLPSSVIVALGEPGVPVICCATPEVVLTSHVASSAMSVIVVRGVLTSLPPLGVVTDVARSS